MNRNFFRKILKFIKTLKRLRYLNINTSSETVLHTSRKSITREKFLFVSVAHLSYKKNVIIPSEKFRRVVAVFIIVFISFNFGLPGSYNNRPKPN